MNAEVYHLEARGPFHFGEGGVGVESARLWPRADTLFAALCLELQTLYGADTLEEFLELFLANNPPLLLSSAFPYAAGKGGPVRFYPRPLLPRPGRPDDLETDLKKAKRFKKVQLVSERIFLDWIDGRSLEEYRREENVRSKEKVWLTEAEGEALADEENTPFWKMTAVPRVTLDRAASLSQIFQSGRVFFRRGGGFWLAVRWLDETWREKVETALHSLGDAGIGGERSAGHGQFNLVGGAEKLPWPDTGGAVVTLAPYCPAKAEWAAGVLGEEARYTAVTRRGWLSSPHNHSLRHKTVWMLGEGSVFAGNGRSVYGRLVDVTPKPFETHHVYRYGFAFPVGVSGHE